LGAAAEPYFNHLVEVAELVAGALTEPDTNLVIAALLHDTIEDAGVTMEELTQRFGTDVAQVVAEVTDDKSLPKQERKRLQVANAPFKSERAQMIKIADKYRICVHCIPAHLSVGIPNGRTPRPRTKLGLFNRFSC